MLSAKLKQLNCTILKSYSSATQCIQSLLIKPDIIVFDYNLLRPNGVEVLRAVKETSPHVSIIILSEPDNNSIYAELMEFRDLHYLTKEKDSTKLINILIQRINNIIETKKKEKNLFEQKMILKIVCIVIIIIAILILAF